MTPVIRRLQNTLFKDQSLGLDDASPLHWNFSERIKKVAQDPNSDFYRKIIPSHMVLNLEYSLLGQQIRANLLSTKPVVNEDQVVEQLISALLLAELLEHVYQHYLIVPREVARLRAQQQLYRKILMAIKGTLPKHLAPDDKVDVGLSFSQQVHENTIFINLYRLLFIRSKRLLDLIAGLDLNANWYRYLIGGLDKYTDPLLPHLGWFFYMPRLLVNLFLLIKHTVPGFWMHKEEESLGWSVRLQGQLLRRWCQLANDSAWVAVGFINCFILTGTLAPIAFYLVIAFFVYDVVVSALRVYIEINRLMDLRKQYQAIAADAKNEKEEIEQQLNVLNRQINFEILRLVSHLLNTIAVVLATSCAAPIFAASAIIPIVGAICMVLICFINFALVAIIDHYRPKDLIEIPVGGVSKLGFFAKKSGACTELSRDKDCERTDDENDFTEGCCTL